MEKFNFHEEYILENDIVFLRPLTKDDFNNLLDFSINEPEIWKYSLVQAGSPENLRNYIGLAMEGRSQEKEYPFIVYDKRKNKFAGSTRFYDIQLLSKTLQLGYTWYGKEFQGTEVNKNCKYLLLQFAFEKMKIERVEFRADNKNEQSIRAMKSIGCIEEGVLRSNVMYPDGKRRNSIVLSILHDEWQDTIQRHLKQKITK
ncbi:MAG: GNAT family N-acetyltransferase [Bacteroidota bacterium]|nr:GNAT family N-acetyltransferase [Bacteroidota bacterium]